MNSVKSISEKSSPTEKSLNTISQISSNDIIPESDDLLEWCSKYIQRFQRRFAFDLDYAELFFDKSEDVLEIGSVPPVMTTALSISGFKVLGVDVSPERFATIFERLDAKVEKVNIETDPLPFDDGRFKQVIFNEVFEHLRLNPIFVVAELNRVLATGGKLFVSTPNPHSTIGILRFLLLNQTVAQGGSIFGEYEKLFTLGHMGHVREYGTTEVIAFFEKMGYVCELVIYRDHSSSLGLLSRVIPSLSPAVSYVFKKRHDAAEPGQESLPAAEAPVPVYMQIIIALSGLPIILIAKLAGRLIGGRLAAHLGLPIVR